MALKIPVEFSNVQLFAPHGTPNVRQTNIVGLTLPFLTGMQYAVPVSKEIADVNGRRIIRDVLGRFSGYYRLPVGFSPVEIYCDDSGVREHAWLSFDWNRPEHMVYIYRDRDNRHVASCPRGDRYFHNIMQMQWYLYGQQEVGSLYGSWKLVSNNQPIHSILVRPVFNNTNNTNKDYVRTWSWLSRPTHHKFVKGKKSITVYSVNAVLSRGSQTTIVVGTLQNGKETCFLDNHLDFKSTKNPKYTLGDFVFEN
jgi:hypothetical protein